VQFTIATTRPTEFIDLTDRVAAMVAVGLRSGFVNVQTQHTTTSIVVNEHEPLLLHDFTALLERTAPIDAAYAHDNPHLRTVNLTDDRERANGHAHCRALLLPSSACLNVVKGAIQLGRWQRLFLVELDGPRERQISLMMVGEDWR
jgi:secondary thiamine-phosphate synthase enzyme